MIIYKNYDQAALDKQYNNRGMVPEIDDHISYWNQSSAVTETSLPVVKNLPYGHLPAEVLDVYPSSKPGSGVLFFIHGGYWQMMNKSSFQFIAAAFLPYDFTVVIISYPLTPDVTMDKIVKSCSTALEWTARNISNYNGNPKSIYLAGHSAGGHLVAMMMTKEYGPKDVEIKGVCGLSGLYNLTPIQLSYVNKPLQMNADLAKALSPVRLTPSDNVNLLLTVGEKESDEYHAQLYELEANWRSQVKSLKTIDVPGLNHFTILNDFANQESFFHKEVRGWMIS